MDCTPFISYIVGTLGKVRVGGVVHKIDRFQLIYDPLAGLNNVIFYFATGQGIKLTNLSQTDYNWLYKQWIKEEAYKIT